MSPDNALVLPRSVVATGSSLSDLHAPAPKMSLLERIQDEFNMATFHRPNVRVHAFLRAAHETHKHIESLETKGALREVVQSHQGHLVECLYNALLNLAQWGGFEDSLAKLEAIKDSPDKAALEQVLRALPDQDSISLRGYKNLTALFRLTAKAYLNAWAKLNGKGSLFVDHDGNNTFLSAAKEQA